ncbi:histidine kinase [Paenibacillus sp. BR2-3]|uniref:sensor histidine kinase n=1 Tax=Paenibacillus sp. BR2-3 TaxID=3048494 RepID=UPI003977C673
MAKTKEKKSYPIMHYVKIMLLISFIALVVDLVISIASISIVKQQSTRNLQDTADLYINRINHDFAYINHYMGWTLANNENLNTMDKYPVNSVAFLKANERLYKRFAELQKNYEQGYNFFYYLENHQYFLNAAPMGISYSDYQKLKQQIMLFVEDKDVYEKFYSKWTPILVNGKYYIINMVPYYDHYLIGLISADDLIHPLRQINLGANGYAALVDEHGKSISGQVSDSESLPQNNETSSILSFMQSRTMVSSEFSNATFSAQMVIRFGAFEKIMIAQLMIILLFFILISTLSAVMMLFIRKVLSPIQSFSENLALITDDGEPANFESSKIIELEQANEQFKNLVEQIKKFKIDIYEQELEKQKIRLDYMKLQIKPHFFLNCLTSIYSMAQIQMYEEIEKMAMATSRYFRYIFQSGENFVRLDDEIEHVRIYLDIQKSRYQNGFSYQIQQSEDTASTVIPPLVLQTFIENSIKYAVSRTQELQIVLAVFKRKQEEEEMIVMRITDTGPGFPPDILEKLMNGTTLEQTGGSRIGIMNTLQRLELLYGQKSKVVFSNGEDGGACVTITLPKLPLT